jgi:hypothetical protein
LWCDDGASFKRRKFSTFPNFIFGRTNLDIAYLRMRSESSAAVAVRRVFNVRMIQCGGAPAKVTSARSQEQPAASGGGGGVDTATGTPYP